MSDVTGRDHSLQEIEARAAAERWLAFIDHGDAASSWEDSSSIFRGAVTPEQWRESLETVQDRLGRPLSRDLESAKYTTELPGAPDGEYVVLTYRTTFERKQNGRETVVPELEDGAWRVSGYFVK